MTSWPACTSPTENSNYETAWSRVQALKLNEVQSGQLRQKWGSLAVSGQGN